MAILFERISNNMDHPHESELNRYIGILFFITVY